MLAPQDARLLRRVIALSHDVRAAGNRPFGALLADAEGNVLAQAVNTQVTTGDCTGHAELNLVRETSARLTRAQFTSATVYASGTRAIEVLGPALEAEARRVFEEPSA